MAICSPLLTLDSMPSLADITGAYGDRVIIDKIKNEWGNGVLFGQIGDPLLDRFKHFTNVVTNVVNNTTNKIINTVSYILDTNKIKPIVEEEHLYAVPACMREHILTYAPIRTYHEQGMIDGWGISPSILPSEDVIARLYNNNGLWAPTYNFVESEGKTVAKPVYPEFIEWTVKSTDPIITWEELETIHDSRIFIDKFLQEQLGPNGDKLDPTAYATGGLIGKLI